MPTTQTDPDPRMSWSDPKAVLKQVWGYDGFRPQQARAVDAILQGRDSLVVMPTGGGKSICYQLPSIVRGDTTVVISPLIALMKDQVDQLRDRDIPAAALNSTLSTEERNQTVRDLMAGNLRLLFVSPERLAQPGFQQMLQKLDIRTFAIDESHCISHWGHDFRPEYRQIGIIRELFPDASIHAFTATATEQVRRDIVKQLRMDQPEILIGNFDRPNLMYRFVPRTNPTVNEDIYKIVRAHDGEAGIIYCATKKHVAEIFAYLKKKKVNVLDYHADLNGEQRKSNQDAFMSEECDVIVATVAFGMGIDRSNVRYVIHRSMPKSLEHYQQEAGRAGRDSLPADCVMFYSWEDVKLWGFILDKAAENADMNGRPSAEEVQNRKNAHQQLKNMFNWSDGGMCRHRMIAEYFNQKYPHGSCGACDRCVKQAHRVGLSLEHTQKILSAVVRVEERFPAEHVLDVLMGKRTPEIVVEKHDALGVFGLMKDADEILLRDWINQLLDQGFLLADGEGAGLRLGIPRSQIRFPEKMPLLLEPNRRDGKVGDDLWKGVDRELYEILRKLRQEVAHENRLTPDAVFGDLTLRELARVKPFRDDQLRDMYGVGEAKSRRYGKRFLAAIEPFLPVEEPAAPARSGRSAIPSKEPAAPKTPDESENRSRLADITAAPDDTPLRRRYADWIRMYDGEYADFIVAQCDASALKPTDPKRTPLEAVAAKMLLKHEKRWLGRFATLFTAVSWDRGFPERLTLTVEHMAMNISEIFQRFPIRELELSGAPWLLKGILASLHLNRIRSLSLRKISLTGEPLKALCVGKPLNLQRLDLGESGIDDDSLDALAGSSRLESLEILNLDKNRLLGDAGAEALMATQALTGLKFIDLSLCPTISGKMREQLKQHFGDCVRL